MNFFLSGPVRVVGRRGSPRREIENTVDSFDRAEAEGADGCLVDARLTADGEVVAHQDSEIFLGSRRGQVAALTVLEVSEVILERGELLGAVPTLRDLFLRYGSEGRWIVDLKPGPAPRPGLLEFRLAALLTQLHLLERSLVLCSTPEPLRRIRDAQPEVETALFVEPFPTPTGPDGRLFPTVPPGCRSIAVDSGRTSEALLARARSEGLAVHVLGVNDEAAARRFAELGVSSLVTDVPGEIVKALRGTDAVAPVGPSPASAR